MSACWRGPLWGSSHYYREQISCSHGCLLCGLSADRLIARDFESGMLLVMAGITQCHQVPSVIGSVLKEGDDVMDMQFSG
jgi:hypothetical protein